ncbi:MAG: DUF512 domain-containing protein [Ruminiclostridium sp.]|nr:DUF512 domain-containing protein [Ruminiclostridium sp.]
MHPEPLFQEVVLSREAKIAIQAVEPGSIADEAGIERGDKLISISGQKIKDIFDYRFLTAEETLTICVQKKDGEVWEIEVEKDQYEDLGMDFEDSLMDASKSCTNKCIFCFIDQLPEGMRETLYFKDDDSRLSYLSGNYATLTNMKDEDLDRIIRYKMSPLNVSVHTTNPELRKFMLGNRFGGAVLAKMRKLAEGGISMNTQIVLCRGINDGDELDRTISELSGLYPGMSSISVVPVGLTRWRKGLHSLRAYDKDSSAEVVHQVEKWQKKLLEEKESRIAYIADEFYIMSEIELPGYSEYEDFPQLENGVGLVAVLKNEFDEYLESFGSGEPAGRYNGVERHISIATGVSVYKYIKEMTDRLEKRYNKLNVTVYPIKNDFFGENVTVTGLLTGRDIAAQLKEASMGQELLISRSMLKAGEEIFLDDFTLKNLSDSLGVTVTVVENTGEDFINKVLGGK